MKHRNSLPVLVLLASLLAAPSAQAGLIQIDDLDEPIRLFLNGFEITGNGQSIQITNYSNTIGLLTLTETLKFTHQLEPSVGPIGNSFKQ
jgi:hypothetical protein